jgi:serine/threonine protein kinase/Tol biopolymer transport system component
MEPDRWQRVEQLLDGAIELPAQEREAFLRRECRDAPELVDEVLSILVAGEQDGSLLDTPAPRFGAALLAGEKVDTPMPERVGPYRIERLIGEGGMGMVYLAHRDDGEFDQQVALKLIRRGLHLDARIVRRFREERQILAALNHPGIARLYDGGLTEDNLPYFAMEFVEGLPVDRYCDSHGLGVDQRLELFARVCDAVAHAHERHIVHRDIKPSNILVTEGGDPRLLDFGIAKLLDAGSGASELTRRSERLLTPEYASPEQIRGEPVVVASDVYCLGVLLYELLTGRRPFMRIERSAHELERAVLEEEPTRPSAATPREVLRRRLKGDLDAIVLTAMRKTPAQRYRTAAEFGADVRRHLRGEPVTARGASGIERMSRWVRRHQVGLSSAGAVAVAAVALLTAMQGKPSRSGDTVLSALRLSGLQHLTNDDGLELDPAISPDGALIAYAGGVEGAMRIFVRRREGVSRPALVSATVAGNHRQPRWSPDGKGILFQADRGLWMVPAGGGSPRRVVSPPGDTATAHSATWSPRGDEIAWVSHDTVFARPVTEESAVPRAIVTLPVAHSLAWSPNGRWIAVVSGNMEFVYHRLGNLGPSALYLAPSGCAVARCTPVLIAPPTSLNTSPAWLDASRLVFVSNRSGPRDLYGMPVSESGATQEPAVPLSAGHDMHTVTVAADGRTVAYSVFRQDSNIWSLDVSSNVPRRLTDATRITSGKQTVEGLELSADGKSLVFDANRTGQQDLYVVPVDGGEQERVVSTPQDKFHPAWSPDGSTLAFHTFHDGVRRAAIAPVSGGGVRLIHPTGPAREQHTPVWMRDGRGLVYFRTFSTGADLYAVRLTSDSTWSAERQLTRRGGMWPSFSADGSRMSYIATPGIVRVMGPELDEESSRVVLDVSAPTSGGVVAHTSVMSPDGTSILVKGVDGTGPGFWRVSVDGGRPRLLARLDDSQRTSPRPEFTSDGKRVFFLLTEREADVWAARLEGR